MPAMMLAKTDPVSGRLVPSIGQMAQENRLSIPIRELSLSSLIHVTQASPPPRFRARLA